MQSLVVGPAAALGLTLALTASPAVAQAQEEWRYCGVEGQTCQFNGVALVRYGAEGRYVFRVARDGQPCDWQSFGVDPVPGVRKQCEVAVGWRAMPGYRGWRESGVTAHESQWRQCAVEGGVCTTPDSVTRVRYGVDGQFVMREVRGQIACNARTFGDPAPGRAKVCEIEDRTAWIVCAHEGDHCAVPGPARVRYGAQGRFAERDLAGGVACNNSVFGDPIVGVAKQCEYRLLTGAQAAAVPVPAPVALPWVACAREDGVCNFRGPAMMRYGANGRYIYREVVDGIECNFRVFGGDPALGVPKQCYVLRIGR